MTADERLFDWFRAHPEALPANIRTYDNGDDQTHGFYKSVSGIGVENYALNDPVLGNRVPKIVQLGLTMALLLWVASRRELTIYWAPSMWEQRTPCWEVCEFGSDIMSGFDPDLATALLDAAEKIEQGE
jgi:hypothetical protein